MLLKNKNVLLLLLIDSFGSMIFFLPIGMMFTGPLGGEDVLLRLSAQIEQDRGWAKLPVF